ncbi:MAG: hypothetical protein ACRECE_07215 [Xanthobacteraceae bacterium]
MAKFTGGPTTEFFHGSLATDFRAQRIGNVDDQHGIVARWRYDTLAVFKAYFLVVADDHEWRRAGGGYAERDTKCGGKLQRRDPSTHEFLPVGCEVLRCPFVRSLRFAGTTASGRTTPLRRRCNAADNAGLPIGGWRSSAHPGDFANLSAQTGEVRRAGEDRPHSRLLTETLPQTTNLRCAAPGFDEPAKAAAVTDLQLAIFAQHGAAATADAPAVGSKRLPTTQQIIPGHAGRAVTKFRSSRATRRQIGEIDRVRGCGGDAQKKAGGNQ